MTRAAALYIHWPFCKSKCPYCDFNSHVRDGVDQKRWRDALLQELAWFADHSPYTHLSSIFFGGGTPSLMPPSTAEALIRFAQDRWKTEGNLEITLEANPTSVEAERFADFRAAGVNRVSLGVQSLRERDLQFLGRQHNAAQAQEAIRLARTIFPRYSFDLIYARPEQTPESWKEELNEALELAEGHLSVYQLTIEEGTQFHHLYHAKKFSLPEEEEAEDMYFQTQEILEARGLPAYETSNHAKPGEECQHNLVYWRYQPYLGIGPGAHGRAHINASDLHATECVRSPEAWLQQVENTGHGMLHSHALGAKDIREEMLMMNLRLREGLSLDAWKAATGLDGDALLPSASLAKLQSLGLVEVSSNRLLATKKGRFLLNSIIRELL